MDQLVDHRQFDLGPRLVAQRLKVCAITR